ncbi:MAG: D-amino acid dehydrogenase [Natronospirillum sp.]|uniref:D-amino acid dehydrogenase n=1 Tax=Natronospirillum sp. TaxID=2812955 RepID=UPI00260006F9|nr:D-amino acid dehydrogenase [Natronospirillum sp.]MCH8552144.1 D-amino acid dehydrogenase [Natronospirillum sp.]
MKVIVAGAGVVGMTTAWALSRRGHQVTVIDALAGPGLETSRGNAGQRCYSFLYPWADPGMIGPALRGLFRAKGPLKLHFPMSARTLQFLFMTTDFALRPGLFEHNRKAMLKLAMLSRDCFAQIDEELGLDYDQGQNGLIETASDRRRQTALMQKARLLDDLDIDYEWLSAKAARLHEPGLLGDAPLQGAIRLPNDGTGDSLTFTRGLAEACAARGVDIRYRTEVTGWDLQYGRIRGVRVRDYSGHQAEHDQGSTGYLTADHFVLAAGCGSRELARQLGVSLPIYPVKGYSLTAPVRNEHKAPRSTVLDDYHKLAISRLGPRIRVTGFAELDDGHRLLPEKRLQVLRQGFQARFPGSTDFSMAKAWTGFRPMLPDGPPAIGRVKGLENLVLNTGHGTFGWTLSAGSAELAAQVVDEERPLLNLEPFRADRFQR